MRVDKVMAEKLVVISDVHANLHALEAVLREEDRAWLGGAPGQQQLRGK